MSQSSGKWSRVLAGAMLLTFVFSMVVTPQSTQAATTQYTPQTQQEMIAYLMGVLAQLQVQVASQSSDKPTTNSNNRPQPNPYLVSALIQVPEKIARDQAILRGTAYPGSAVSYDAWFEYGVGTNLKSRSELYSKKEKTSSTRSRSSGSRATATPRTTTRGGSAGGVAISLAIEDLKPDTKYTYRLVVEDDKGYRQYSQTRTFTTVAKASDEEFSGVPGLDTEGVEAVTTNAGIISGFVTMNDYETGKVFVIYGTDRSKVNDLEDIESYDDVSVLDTSIKKAVVKETFAGRDTLTYSLKSLKAATNIHYRFCVEYDDVKKGDTVICGETESFTTSS